MGMFDWLFGKKQSSGVAAPPAPAQPGNPSRARGDIASLLQRCKDLPPTDSSAAADLVREMLQEAVQASGNSAQLSELNMALDSMARHYAPAVQQLALEHPEPAVRERAARLLLERRDPRGLRPAVRLAGSGVAGSFTPLLRDLVREQTGQLTEEDLTALTQLNGPGGENLVELRQLAEQEMQRRRQGHSPAVEVNLRRWRQFAARAWVEAHRGQWNHQDWLDLLVSLQRSEYWPLKPEEVGQTLEELKREYFAHAR